MMKISVIIPIFNVEKYLHECLYSVSNQTLKEIEIICIDDGSTDQSAEIIDWYANNDSRIIAIHKDNSGYGHSVNIGMDIAKGKYIAIVEPDDYIELNMFEQLFLVAEENSVDFVKSHFIEFYGEKGYYNDKIVQTIPNPKLFDKVLYKEDSFELLTGFAANWTGIYNRDFINKNKIRHSTTPGASYQDTGFFFQVMMHYQKGYILNSAFYHYRQDNPNSSINNINKAFYIFDEMSYIKNRIYTYNKLEYLSVYQWLKFNRYQWTINRLLPQYKKEFFNRMVEEFAYDNANGELTFENFLGFDAKRVKCLLNNTEKAYKKLVNPEEYLEEVLSEYDKILICGAGTVAKSLYSKFSDSLKQKVKGFMVTELSNAPKQLFNKPVKQLSKLTIENNSCVLIAVTSRYENELYRIISTDNHIPIICI